MAGRSYVRELVRDAFVLAACILCVVSIVRQTGVLTQVKEGRRISLTISCAATSAVIDAGRATIVQGAKGLPPKLAANLERLGYPKAKQREAAAKAAAEAYAALIVNKVRLAAGSQAVGVVKPNGSLDCKRLAEVARVAK